MRDVFASIKLPLRCVSATSDREPKSVWEVRDSSGKVLAVLSSPQSSVDARSTGVLGELMCAASNDYHGLRCAADLGYDAIRRLSNAACDRSFFRRGAPAGDAAIALRDALHGDVFDEI
jgi:hypothetical protein